ncbi:hypothetical protein E4K72_15425, partial [Oxalobacteraceae bacterium OM1]
PAPTPSPTPAPAPLPSGFPSTIVLSSDKPQGATEGDSIRFSVTVDAPKASGQYGPAPSAPPTGTVTIYFQNQRCVATLSPPSPTPGPRGSCIIDNVLAGDDWNVVAVYSGDANWRASVVRTQISVKPKPSSTPAPTPAPAPAPVYPPAPTIILPPPTSNIIVTVIVNNIINIGGGGNIPSAGNPAVPSQPAVKADATLARFDAPTGIARDKQGNLYVSDRNNCTIRKIALDGTVTTIAGFAGQKGKLDGVGPLARFTAPSALTIDGKGNLYVLDNRDLRKIVIETGVVTTIVASPEIADTTTDNFLLPDSLAADSKGNLFVSDYLLGAIWRVDVNTPPTAEQISAGQTAPVKVSRFATLSAGIFDPLSAGPSSIAVDALDNLYVSELPYSPNANGASTIRKIDATGMTMSTLVDATVGLVNVHGLALDATGDLFVNENSLLLRLNPVDRSIVTYKLPGSPAGGTVTAASIVANEIGDRLYFTDAAKNTVDVLQPDGAIQVIAGKAGEKGSIDVTP